LSIAVTPSGKFAYTANATDFTGGPGTVSAYALNAATGVLTPVEGSPFLTGASPQGVVVAPSGKYLYVSNALSNDVSEYSINTTTGALTKLSTSPVAAGDGPFGLVMHPSGRFLFAVNLISDSVSGYSINATTGDLTPVPGSPFTTGVAPQLAAVTPLGRFLYVSNFGSESVSAYSINATTGVLSPVAGSPFPTPGGSECVTVLSSGKFAYVANSLSGNVSGYEIDPMTGALTQVPGSPFGVANQPSFVAEDPSDQFLYVADRGDNVLRDFSIDADTGALSAFEVYGLSTGSGPTSIAFSTPAVSTACGATNITKEINLYPSALVGVPPLENFWAQTITLTNSSAEAIPGPINLVMAGLPRTGGSCSDAHSSNPTCNVYPTPPLTYCFSKAGSSLLTLSDGGLAPGQQIKVQPTFLPGPVTGSTPQGFTYTGIVLSGTPNK
jgi:6-phosphogluconolactonase (cycloisomerase 2 family)